QVDPLVRRVQLAPCWPVAHAGDAEVQVEEAVVDRGGGGHPLALSAGHRLVAGGEDAGDVAGAVVDHALGPEAEETHLGRNLTKPLVGGSSRRHAVGEAALDRVKVLSRIAGE